MMLQQIFVLLSYITIGLAFIYIYLDVIHPFLIRITTKEIERNPKWLTSELWSHYYGLKHIDLIIVENNKFNITPLMKISKNKKRLEFLIPNEIATVRNIDDIAKILLIGEICIKVGSNIAALYTDKPTYWLSILNYMLDGGNINQSEVSWEEKE